MTKFELLKGTFDSLPKEQIKINKILEIIKESFESYGFRPFDSPIIEYFQTLTFKYNTDDEITEEIFKVTDRGKRELGLRYDLTTPLSRFVATEKQLKKPFRRYQIGKVFRDGPIKSGRAREFIQCDGDVVGVEGIEIEAELLSMFYFTYKKLGIEPILELNNNKILRGVLLQEGFSEDNLSSLILSIDKLKKIGEEGVIAEIKKKKLDSVKAMNAIKILNLKSFQEIKEIAKNDLLKEGILELEKLIKLIKSQSIDFRVNYSMSRGLNIYTGNIWEAYDKKLKINSSIGAGGRYDKVIGDYLGNGEIVPALGVSFGLIPIIACLEKNEDYEGVTDILIVPLDIELVEKSFEIANILRNKKQNVEIFYGYKLKKAFNYANYLGCNKIAIIGKKDIENRQYTLKNLLTGDEEKISF